MKFSLPLRNYSNTICAKIDQQFPQDLINLSTMLSMTITGFGKQKVMYNLAKEIRILDRLESTQEK